MRLWVLLFFFPFHCFEWYTINMDYHYNQKHIKKEGASVAFAARLLRWTAEPPSLSEEQNLLILISGCSLGIFPAMWMCEQPDRDPPEWRRCTEIVTGPWAGQTCVPLGLELRGLQAWGCGPLSFSVRRGLAKDGGRREPVARQADSR